MLTPFSDAKSSSASELDRMMANVKGVWSTDAAMSDIYVSSQASDVFTPFGTAAAAAAASVSFNQSATSAHYSTVSIASVFTPPSTAASHFGASSQSSQAQDSPVLPHFSQSSGSYTQSGSTYSAEVASASHYSSAGSTSHYGGSGAVTVSYTSDSPLTDINVSSPYSLNAPYDSLTMYDSAHLGDAYSRPSGDYDRLVMYITRLMYISAFFLFREPCDVFLFRCLQMLTEYHPLY